MKSNITFERDYHDDVKINKYKLPEECEQHAAIYLYWAEQFAIAKSDSSDAKKRADLIAVEADSEIRSNWKDSYGRLTEGAVKSKVDNNEQVIAAREQMNSLERRINLLGAAVSAMEQRKSELNNLVTLLVNGFYAAPNGNKRAGITEQTGHEIRGKMNSKKHNEEDTDK